MATIVGYITDEDFESIKNAGYPIEQVAEKTILIFPREMVAARVDVDADVIELLMPPLCWSCGFLMVRPAEKQKVSPDGTGGLLYACPACGGKELRLRYRDSLVTTQGDSLAPTQGEGDGSE